MERDRERKRLGKETERGERERDGELWKEMERGGEMGREVREMR